MLLAPLLLAPALFGNGTEVACGGCAALSASKGRVWGGGCAVGGSGLGGSRCCLHPVPHLRGLQPRGEAGAGAGWWHQAPGGRQMAAPLRWCSRRNPPRPQGKPLAPARALLQEVWLWGGCDRCVPRGCCSLPGLAGAVPRTGSELFPACSLPGQQGPCPRPHRCHFCLHHSLGSVLPHSTWEPVRQTSVPGLCSQSKNLSEPRSGEAHRGEERRQCVQQLWCVSAGRHGGSHGQQEPPGCSARPAPLRRLRCSQLHRSHTLHRFTKNIG